MSRLDRQSVVPLYYQIQQCLLEQIRQGSLKPGESLPSEHEIAQQFGVSRMTGRHALQALRDVGLAFTVRGKGTFVSKLKLEKDFRQVTSFTEEMQARSLRPSSKVLNFELLAGDEEVAEALHLGPGEKVISLRRIRFASSSPMGIEWSRIPHRLCPDLLDSYDPRTSLYEALAQRGVRMAMADEIIEAGLIGAAEARLLGAQARNPIFLFTRTSYLENGEPAEFVKSIYRADRYKIVNRLTRIGRALLAEGAQA